MLSHLVHTHCLYLADCCGQGDSAHCIRATSFIAVGRSRPYNIIQGDDLHRAATGHVGVAMLENIPSPHQGTRPEGSVHLMGRDGDEIQMSWFIQGQHIHLAMRGELGAIH